MTPAGLDRARAGGGASAAVATAAARTGDPVGVSGSPGGPGAVAADGAAGPARARPGAARTRRGLIAAIHARARAVGMATDDRRDLQARLTGRRSCADMTLPQLRRVAEDLRLAELRLRPRPVDATRAPSGREGMRRRARALARDVGVGDAYLDAIAQRQSGVSFAGADPQQLRGVIAALYRHRKRQRAAR